MYVYLRLYVYRGRSKRNSTMNIFANQQTPPLKKPEENNTKSTMEYLEINYNYQRNIGETQTKEKAYRTKNKKLKICRKPVKPTKNSLL